MRTQVHRIVHDHSSMPIMIRKTQRPAAERRESRCRESSHNPRPPGVATTFSSRQRAASLTMRKTRRCGEIFSREVSRLIPGRHSCNASFGDLLFAFVFVKAAAGFAPEHFCLATSSAGSPARDRGRRNAFSSVSAISTVISTPISSINRSGPIGIPHSSSASIDLLRADAGLKQLGRVEQVGKENAVDQKPGAVLHQHRQLPDLPREGQRALDAFRRRSACRPRLQSVSSG